MVEEQVTVDDLQKIADEVSEALRCPSWQVVLRKPGSGVAFVQLRRRIVISQTWLATCNVAKFKCYLVWSNAVERFICRGPLLLIIAGFTVVVLPFLPWLTSVQRVAGVPFLQVWWFALFAIFGVLASSLCYFLIRVVDSEAFLTQALDLTKDPQAVKEFLVEQKARPKTLAKFDAMAKAMDVPAQG